VRKSILWSQIKTPITVESLNKMNYLKACIRESHRKSPISLRCSRVAEKDVVIRGYQIPKGTSVTIHNWCMSNYDHYFSDPSTYNPERWLKGCPQRKEIHPYASMPFGHGVRTCIGKRLAELEMWLLVTKVIKNFRVVYDMNEHGEIKPITRLVCIPDKPLRFKFIDV